MTTRAIGFAFLTHLLGACTGRFDETGGLLLPDAGTPLVADAVITTDDAGADTTITARAVDPAVETLADAGTLLSSAPFTASLPDHLRVSPGGAVSIDITVSGTARTPRARVRLSAAPLGVALEEAEIPLGIATTIRIEASSHAEQGGPFDLVLAMSDLDGRFRGDVRTRLYVGTPGTADRSFGTGGVASFSSPFALREPALVAACARGSNDGLFIVTDSFGTTRRSFLTRVNRDGVAESIFGLGTVPIDLSALGDDARVTGIAPLADGRVVLAAASHRDSTSLLMLFQSTGGQVVDAMSAPMRAGAITSLVANSHDRLFGVVGDDLLSWSVDGGEFVPHRGPEGGVARSLGFLGGVADFIDRDQRTWVHERDSTGRAWRVARLDRDGRVDETFGAEGVTALPAPSHAPLARVTRVVPAPRGGAWVIGAIYSPLFDDVRPESYLMQVDAEGHLVEDFGVAGTVRLSVGAVVENAAATDRGIAIVIAEDDVLRVVHYRPGTSRPESEALLDFRGSLGARIVPLGDGVRAVVCADRVTSGSPEVALVRVWL